MTKNEKKARIAKLKNELKELQSAPRSDWHTAFEAFLRLKTYGYENISIRTEVEIGMDAPRTDYLILIDNETHTLEDKIFKIFRKINILEYKNPNDSLNKRVIYKIIGYANLLIGTAERENDIPEDQVTISIFRSTKNLALWNELEKSGKLINTDTSGIYYITRITELPFQIVITSELKGEEYAVCRALTDKANETDIIHIIKHAENQTNDSIREYYKIFLDLIAEKNPDIFTKIRRDHTMRGALMEIMKDDVNKRLDAREQETIAASIKNLMSNLGFTSIQAMDALNIPLAQRNVYLDLVNEKHDKS